MYYPCRICAREGLKIPQFPFELFALRNVLLNIRRSKHTHAQRTSVFLVTYIILQDALEILERHAVYVDSGQRDSRAS